MLLTGAFEPCATLKLWAGFDGTEHGGTKPHPSLLLPSRQVLHASVIESQLSFRVASTALACGTPSHGLEVDGDQCLRDQAKLWVFRNDVVGEWDASGVGEHNRGEGHTRTRAREAGRTCCAFGVRNFTSAAQYQVKLFDGGRG